MTTVNYPSPVMVNGYSCKNCTEVDEAKKHIDPAFPKDGPFGVNAANQPTNPDDPNQAKARAAQKTAQTTTGPATPLDPAIGRLLNISA